jgi:hypothetical protein
MNTLRWPSIKKLFLDHYNRTRGKSGWPSNLWIINFDGSGMRNIRLDFSAVAGQAPAARIQAGGRQ